jgi:hypothetical protein
VLGLVHYPLETNVPIACGGVLVLPGDVVVGDAEGVVVVPAALAEEVAWDALEQEDREAWGLERVKAGESIRDVYPIAESRLPEYLAWREARRASRAERRPKAPAAAAADGNGREQPLLSRAAADSPEAS